MMWFRSIAVVIIIFLSFKANSNLIQNGTFDNCNFTGWEKDTDGFGDISLGNDFEMVPVGASRCRAAINVDYFDPAGDAFGFPISEAFFANTLFQELDFTGSAGSTFKLTIGFEVGSESNNSEPSFIADYFLIGLNDGFGNYFDDNGDLGLLVGPTDIEGSFRDELTFDIDSSFLNQTGWYLDFQLNIGWDGQTGFSDAYGSTMYINNVSMIEVKEQVSEVPEPSTLAILIPFLIGLIGYKKIKS